MPADGMLAARSHARISASPASRAATQNLFDFSGTLYPQLGGVTIRCRWLSSGLCQDDPESQRWHGSNKIKTIRRFVAEGARNIGARYLQAGTDGRSRAQ